MQEGAFVAVWRSTEQVGVVVDGTAVEGTCGSGPSIPSSYVLENDLLAEFRV